MAKGLETGALFEGVKEECGEEDSAMLRKKIKQFAGHGAGGLEDALRATRSEAGSSQANASGNGPQA